MSAKQLFKNSTVLALSFSLCPSLSLSKYLSLLWFCSWGAGTLYPSLQQLESACSEDSDDPEDWIQKPWKRAPVVDKELERENECGICMEHSTKMVLPTCNHAMCINCYHDWYIKNTKKNFTSSIKSSYFILNYAPKANKKENYVGTHGHNHAHFVEGA